MRRAIIACLLVSLSVAGGAAAATQSTGTTTQGDDANATAELPPGLSADGVDDPFALAQAHDRTLRNVSHTMSTTHSFRRPNGTLLSYSTTTAQVTAGGERFSAVHSQTNRNATRPLGVAQFAVEQYADGERTVVARTRPDGTTTYREQTGDAASVDSQWEGFYTAFMAVETTVTDQWERNGTAYYRVASASQPGPDSVFAGASDGPYSMAAVVDENGVVRTFQETRRTTLDGEPAVYTRTVHVTQVGDTTVERPDWYPRAAGNATSD